MHLKPLVSIITVVYNGEKHLQQTIDSVRDQTYKHIEYIIIDGGSTDETINIIKRNEDVISKWISEKDNGLYDAMNKGIKLANGALIGMINSDDWFELDAVEIMANTFVEYPNKTIFHADRYDVYSNQDKRLKKYNPSVFKFKFYGMTYHHPSMFITKSEYKTHLYNTNLKALSDYQFVLEAFMKTPESFHYVNKSIVNYRLEGVSAQMNLYNRLKEGYISRREAGMFILHNCFSLSLRCTIFILNSFKRIFK